MNASDCNSYGVIVCPGYSPNSVKNIGDYVQSYAALQYVPNDCEPLLLDREHLNDIKQSNKKIKVIMNGWWMANPQNFPPSPSIDPLYVSFHLVPKIESSFFTPSVIEHLKQHQPIGCRDTNTVQLMKKHNIEAYYSSCLTLTLGKTFKRHTTDESKFIFVNPIAEKVISKNIGKSTKNIINCIRVFFKKPKTILSMVKNEFYCYNHSRNIINSIINSSRIYYCFSNTFSDEVLRSAIYINHDIPKKKNPTDKERLEITRVLLEQYSTAKFVVTSRIHCALPCLGIGTPVVFVTSDKLASNPRVKSFKEFFRNAHIEKGICYLDKNDFNVEMIDASYSFENYDKHLVYANKLKEKCELFFS